jgi:hypothetical protein
LRKEDREFVAFVNSAPDFTIEGGMVCYTPVGGGVEDRRCMPVSVFRQWVEAGTVLLSDWDARNCAPIPLTRKG